LVTRRLRRRALALGSIVLLAGALCAADDRAAVGGAIPAPALRELAAQRRLTDCLAAPTDDSGLELAFRGRLSIEIKGRERGGDASGAVRDLAVFDPAAGRIVSYVCYANASTRASGEAIVSLAVVSSRADKLARALLPGSNLVPERQRHWTGGREHL
jgi:hypothetical protein